MIILPTLSQYVVVCRLVGVGSRFPQNSTRTSRVHAGVPYGKTETVNVVNFKSSTGTLRHRQNKLYL